MIIGKNSRDNDLDVNVVREKKMTTYDRPPRTSPCASSRLRR
jgi:predicted membrane GTPase involved in stress response